MATPVCLERVLQKGYLLLVHSTHHSCLCIQQFTCKYTSLFPGSKDLHFHDSMHFTYLSLELAVNNLVALTQGIAIYLAVLGAVNRKSVLMIL